MSDEIEFEDPRRDDDCEELLIRSLIRAHAKCAICNQPLEDAMDVTHDWKLGLVHHICQYQRRFPEPARSVVTA